MARGAAPDLEPSHVADLFDRNAATYDRINTVITFGLDASWRRWAARQAVPRASVSSAQSPSVLDACAGTGLLALDLAHRGATVTAADAAARMLAVASDRLAAAGLPLRAVVADLSDPAAAAALGGPFDAITVGFGLRYFADPGALLRPLRGLLAPGGRLVIIEAVSPPRDVLGAAAGVYFFHVAPRLGAALARSRRALRIPHGLDARPRLGRRRGRSPARRGVLRRRAATPGLRRGRRIRRQAGLISPTTTPACQPWACGLSHLR